MQFAVLPASSSDRPSSKPVSVQISDAVVPDHCYLCQLLTQGGGAEGGRGGWGEASGQGASRPGGGGLGAGLGKASGQGASRPEGGRGSEQGASRLGGWGRPRGRAPQGRKGGGGSGRVLRYREWEGPRGQGWGEDSGQGASRLGVGVGGPRGRVPRGRGWEGLGAGRLEVDGGGCLEARGGGGLGAGCFDTGSGRGLEARGGAEDSRQGASRLGVGVGGPRGRAGGGLGGRRLEVGGGGGGVGAVRLEAGGVGSGLEGRHLEAGVGWGVGLGEGRLEGGGTSGKNASRMGVGPRGRTPRGRGWGGGSTPGQDASRPGVGGGLGAGRLEAGVGGLASGQDASRLGVGVRPRGRTLRGWGGGGASGSAAENSALSSSLQERSSMVIQLSEKKSQAEAEIEMLKSNIESCEREINSLKYELHINSKELEIRNEEKNMSVRSAEVANKQHLEGVKKVAKLEVECQRLRGLVRKKYPGPAALAQMKLEVESLGRDYGGSRKFHKENQQLTERLLAMEEETKMLKKALAHRNSELQSSRSICAKTSNKLQLQSLEAQLQANFDQKSPQKSTIRRQPSEGSFIHEANHLPRLVSMSEDGNDDNVSCGS
ncbi:hypothetical protein KY290_023482 [Solanum tuberosum]|uniref:Uncharacterized protein n=1 Tax=Solanum tuberosum TaxID=4113 RepID=A0ABQ7V7F6_SOLTU|nr:hypothetical protein KY290_023482 [Solanum tuberosum]